MKLAKSILWAGLYVLYLTVIIVIADIVYARYEKLPFQHCTLIVQSWQPTVFIRSDIPGLIYEMAPNLKMHDIYLETNAVGIRGKDYKIPKPVNTFRVMILGDSVAYGPNLTQEETFSALLEAALNNNREDRAYEVINASVPGYNTMQEYIALINKYYIYRPDLVLVAFCQNDLSPAFVQTADRRGMFYGYLKHKLGRMKDNYSVENITPFEMLSISMPDIFHLPPFMHRRLLLFSSLYRAAAIKTYDVLSARYPHKYTPQAYFHVVNDQSEYAIRHLKEYCQANGIDLTFILFPVLTDTYPLPGVPDNIGKTKKILEGNSIKYLDPRPYYHSRVDTLSRLVLNKDEIYPAHLNALGHRLTADLLSDYLKEYFQNK